jgi:phosphoenolpyruvate carboxylase
MSTTVHKPLRRQDITFEEKDQSLRDDVRTLGAMVGELILEQNGEELFELVENSRLRAIRRREGNEKPGEELTSLVKDLDPAVWSIRPRRSTAFDVVAITFVMSRSTSPVASKTR